MAEPRNLDRQEIIPTLVSYSPSRRAMVIGDEARALGVKGHTNAHDFKMQIGSPPGEFDRKAFWVQIPEPGKPPATTFSCREISTMFLREVLSRCIDRYEKIMIGIPALQDETWVEHYRSNIREIVQSLGFSEPSFLPEPFAVFQYYRHVEKLISEERRSQLILLVDIGGGTCNTCIVKTTGEGMIALGGQASKPHGTRAVNFGGKALDVELLRAAINTNKDLAGLFKENPIERARSSLSALLKIEDAKINLCNQIASKPRSSQKEQARLHFERGELSPDTSLNLELTRLHLENVVRNAWSSQWLHAVTGTIKAAENELGAPINEIDKVILCGGCGQLPFLREFVAKSLTQWLRSINDVVVGKTPGFAVARGIQKECEIRAGKEPSLLANDLGRWALSSMYLGFRRNRVEKYIPVKVKAPERQNPYLLIPEWTRLDKDYVECEIEMPFPPGDRLYFGLFDRQIGSGDDPVPLNVQQDTVRVPPGAYRENAKFLLKQTPEGALDCEIVLYKRNGTAERRKLPEFFPESLRIHSGKSILGLDFGTSNTYLVELNLAQEARETDYFSFRIRPTVKDYLADLQTRLRLAKDEGLLAKELLERDAFERRIDFVCHSVKLEGAEITRGETLEVLEKSKSPTSKGQREAKQLGEAYQWMLENYDVFLERPESFARELNKTVLQELNVEAGKYRTGSVKVPTREGDYFPPDGPLVPIHMKQWGEYVRAENKGRSPVEFSAALHSIFVRIHPFADGNGRTARLLANAYLLSQRLPIMVPTIDDRERYVDSLAESDSGNGDEFTMYLIELLQESIEGLQHPAKTLAVNIDPDVDVSLEDEDPLADVMGKLIARDRLPATKVYEPWRTTFEGLRAEMDLLVNQFNQKYMADGYEAKLIVYNILSEEKFSRLFLGLPTTKTWFFGLEVRTWRTKERFMFYFQHDLNSPTSGDEGCVVLRISRFDGNEYRNLTPDVFQPSEIGWNDGSLQFDWPEEQYKTKPLRFQVSLLLAEIIKAFFQQPNELRAASERDLRDRI